MRTVKTFDVRINEEAIIPVEGESRQARQEEADILLLIQEGKGVRAISVRQAWPVSMSKLCRKRRQAIIDTRPAKVDLKGENEISDESLQAWKMAALSYYRNLCKKRLKLASLKNLALPDRQQLVLGASS